MPGGHGRSRDIPEGSDVSLRRLLDEFERLRGQGRNRVDDPFDRAWPIDVGVIDARQNVGIAEPAGEPNPYPGAGYRKVLPLFGHQVVEVAI